MWCRIGPVLIEICAVCRYRNGARSKQCCDESRDVGYPPPLRLPDDCKLTHLPPPLRRSPVFPQRSKELESKKGRIVALPALVAFRLRRSIKTIALVGSSSDNLCRISVRMFWESLGFHVGMIEPAARRRARFAH
jgi:hypothetical protein